MVKIFTILVNMVNKLPKMVNFLPIKMIPIVILNCNAILNMDRWIESWVWFVLTKMVKMVHPMVKIIKMASQIDPTSPQSPIPQPHSTTPPGTCLVSILIWTGSAISSHLSTQPTFHHHHPFPPSSTPPLPHHHHLKPEHTMFYQHFHTRHNCYCLIWPRLTPKWPSWV